MMDDGQCKAAILRQINNRHSFNGLSYNCWGCAVSGWLYIQVHTNCQQIAHTYKTSYVIMVKQGLLRLKSVIQATKVLI